MPSLLNYIKNLFLTEEEKAFRANVKVFCREIQAWIDDGCKYGAGFSSAVGLCHNYKRWSGDRLAYEKLGALFEQEGLDRHYPFEQECRDAFNMQFHNVKRLAWIKEHMK